MIGCRAAGLLWHGQAEIHTSKSELLQGVDKGGGVRGDKRTSHPTSWETLTGICRIALQNLGSERGAGRCGYNKGGVGMERRLAWGRHGSRTNDVIYERGKF